LLTPKRVPNLPNVRHQPNSVEDSAKIGVVPNNSTGGPLGSTTHIPTHACAEFLLDVVTALIGLFLGVVKVPTAVPGLRARDLVEVELSVRGKESP
jgi:hypothetical protein